MVLVRECGHHPGEEADDIGTFDKALAREAMRQGLDGLLCGHVHKPEIKKIGGVLSSKTGDCEEYQSALVEELSGKLRLVTW